MELNTDNFFTGNPRIGILYYSCIAVHGWSEKCRQKWIVALMVLICGIVATIDIMIP